MAWPDEASSAARDGASPATFGLQALVLATAAGILAGAALGLAWPPGHGEGPGVPTTIRFTPRPDEEAPRPLQSWHGEGVYRGSVHAAGATVTGHNVALQWPGIVIGGHGSKVHVTVHAWPEAPMQVALVQGGVAYVADLNATGEAELWVRDGTYRFRLAVGESAPGVQASFAYQWTVREQQHR